MKPSIRIFHVLGRFLDEPRLPPNRTDLNDSCVQSITPFSPLHGQNLEVKKKHAPYLRLNKNTARKPLWPSLLSSSDGPTIFPLVVIPILPPFRSMDHKPPSGPRFVRWQWVHQTQTVTFNLKQTCPIKKPRFSHSVLPNTQLSVVSTVPTVTNQPLCTRGRP